MRPITVSRRDPASMEGVHFTGSHGSMSRSTDTDTTNSVSLTGSEARDTFTMDADDLINPAKRDPNFRDDNNNSMNFDTKKGMALSGRRSIGAMSDSGASFQTMITASETVGSVLESPYVTEDASVDCSVLSREASVDPPKVPLSHQEEEAFLKGEDPDFQPEFETISWEQSPKGLSRQSSTRSELTTESFGPAPIARQGSSRPHMSRSRSKRGMSFRKRGSSRMLRSESEPVIQEGDEVANEVTLGATSPVSDFPDSTHSRSEDSVTRSTSSLSRASPMLVLGENRPVRPQAEDLNAEDSTKPSLNDSNMAFVSRSASSFGSADAPGLASSDVSLESTSPGVMSGRATLGSVPQMQSELSPVKEKKKSRSKKEKKSKKGRSRRNDDDSSRSSHRSEATSERYIQRVERLQPESPRRRDSGSSNRSASREDTPRLSHKKSLSASARGQRPTLHTLFEWSYDDKVAQGSRPRPGNNPADTPKGNKSPVRSRQQVRRASNDGSLRSRSHSRESPRGLLSRSMSMPDLNQDIQQMTMTPKWPKRRFNNSSFHQQFYHKDHEKVRPGVATARRRPKSEGPSVTPQQLLNIMEPCSMREVLAFNGFNDEFGPASNHMVNYADVLDNQSVFTASTGPSSARNLKKSRK
uniref:Uncharacterized protein n=1 Tax=Grammatophora oceanica TaxID=210454 RepID=A0A7S1YB28_9STRA|mmetsp:Transcript_36882/g.54934  ORF Transcript_36882/g.54934 Transcript_36882/m.54934 type:complete len:642 (+) Transcript_36882:93-2018(+)